MVILDPYPVFIVLKLLLKRQFEHLRENDAYWFENKNYLKREILEEIQKITFSDVLAQTTSLPNGFLFESVFKVPNSQSFYDLHFRGFPAGFVLFLGC